ncbi:hypothetical protein ACIQ9E_15615 [Streptomyces sp. NPDC094448]|uniref:hypothetical protein n=1 Tax=Streptomyces sp. NPDC094448 TaxID=3366063 RepID=UPI0038161875
MKKLTAATVGTFALLASMVIVAPPASAVPAGCGQLTNGQLCSSGGTLGTTGTYTFTTSYWRTGGSGEITVTLGTQRKNSNITAFPLWFGSKRTQNGYVELKKSHSINSGECIRGVMEHNNTTYVTKWRCP